MSMSLDGFVADADDGVGEVFDWYTGSGDVVIETGGSDPMTFTVSAAERRALPRPDLPARRRAHRPPHVRGRRRAGAGTTRGDRRSSLTHEVPAGWPRPDSTVHFVTDGIESAVRQAKAAAGGKDVGVHGADTIQQLLNAGLLDELSVDVAALLLGSGVRLFDHLAATPAVLGNPTVTQGVGVTHLRYPVQKN